MTPPTQIRPIDVTSLTDLGTTVCVFAHPDDETYLCGGIAAALRHAGHRVVFVTATRGELGGSEPSDELARRRTQELDAAMRTLGVDEHHWLDLPDGGCDAVPEAGPAATIEALLRDVQPKSVLSFGPDGLTGHPDHRAVARWTEVAHARAQVSGATLLQAAVTVGHRAAWGALEDELEVNVGVPALPVEVADLAVHAELSGALLDRKVAALAQQASQTQPLLRLIGDERYRRWVALETFRAAGRT